jgi:hypothetical protein
MANARGHSVGNGIDANFIGHPFIYARGEILPIDLPPSAIGSAPSGINGKGEIVGQFFDEVRTIHGFLKAESVYTIFDFPGANWTSVQGINNAGRSPSEDECAEGRDLFAAFLAVRFSAILGSVH